MGKSEGFTCHRQPQDPDSSLQAWLAHDLRLYRKRAGMSQEELGEALGRTGSNLSNIEAGRRSIDEDDAKKLDELWDTGGHFRRLVIFARRNHSPDWFREHVSYEERATIIKIFEPMFVPGLLQTPEYAMATLVAGGGM
jgi:transcriptional regulator with XRE-family HTH domain